MRPFKNKSNLKKNYTIHLEIGLILSLLIFLVAMKVPIREPSQQEIKLTEQQEVVNMEDMERTKQEEKPPAPPRPAVPVEVPNDEVVTDQVLNIDAELNLNESNKIPAPPPEKKKEKKEKEEDFFVVVEQMPKLKGGLAKLQSKIRYPEMARKAGIEGRVVVQFIINEQGEVEDPKVIRGIGGGCDKEALRVVKQAQFEPGRQRGEPVRVQYSLPIRFRLKRN